MSGVSFAVDTNPRSHSVFKGHIADRVLTIESGDFFMQVRVNSSSKREPYPVIFLARLLIAQKHFRSLRRAIEEAISNIKPYTKSLLCE